jgi:hypothetical protein
MHDESTTFTHSDRPSRARTATRDARGGLDSQGFSTRPSARLDALTAYGTYSRRSDARPRNPFGSRLLDAHYHRDQPVQAYVGRYALHMHLRVLFERLRVRRRPPTGPLTTAETTAAEELRQETQAKDSKRSDGKQQERS